MQSLLSKSVAYCIHGVVTGPSQFCCSYAWVIVSTCPCPAMHLPICLCKLLVPDWEIQLVNRSLQNLQRYFVVTLPSGFGISSLSKHHHMFEFEMCFFRFGSTWCRCCAGTRRSRYRFHQKLRMIMIHFLQYSNILSI